MIRVLSLALLLAAQDPPDPMRDLRAQYDRWQKARAAFHAAFNEARARGQTGKGTQPEDVQKLRDEADRVRDAILKEYAERADLPADAQDLLSRAWEDARDYGRASDALEKYVESLGPQHRQYRPSLYRLSLAALNSKNAERAATWMRALIDAERGVPKAERVGDSVRTMLYPRQLVALERWDALIAFADELEKDGDDERTREGVVLARFLGSMGLKRHDDAGKVIDGVRSKPDRHAGQQTWSVIAKVAFLASRGKYAESESLLAEHLKTEEKDLPPAEKNQRRYAKAVAKLLGRPAPEVVVDHWVGADHDPGAKPLPSWRGNVVVLDFWQPWCEPCRNHMPALSALAGANKNLKVVGLCRSEDYGYDVAERKAVRPLTRETYPAHVAKFREEMKLPYPLAISDTVDNNKAYGIIGVPTLVMLDGEGIVRWASVGAGERGLMEMVVEGMLRRP